MNRSPHFRTNAVPIVIAVLLLIVSTSCVTRTSSESLRKEIAALRAENFQLRKDLTESRVRLEMLAEEADPAAASAGSPAAASLPAAAPLAGQWCQALKRLTWATTAPRRRATTWPQVNRALPWRHGRPRKACPVPKAPPAHLPPQVHCGRLAPTACWKPRAPHRDRRNGHRERPSCCQVQQVRSLGQP